MLVKDMILGNVEIKTTFCVCKIMFLIFSLGHTECSRCSLGLPGIWNCVDDNHVHAEIFHGDDCTGETWFTVDMLRDECVLITDEMVPAEFNMAGLYFKSTWNGDCHSIHSFV